METNQQALNLLFAPSKSSHKYSSQHLKHVYENYVKDYISVDDFEKLMKENGYKITRKGLVYCLKTDLAKSYN